MLLLLHLQVLDEKQTTVFKRALDAAYMLKLKAARNVFGIICRDFPAMPFTTRSLAEVCLHACIC